MRLQDGTEYREWDFFDEAKCHEYFVCLWHEVNEHDAETVVSPCSEKLKEPERRFLRQRAWEAYERHRNKVAV